LNLPTFFAFVTTTIIFLTAASTSRIYVSDGRFVVIVIAMLLYVIGNLLMVRIMREIGLGIAISVSTFAQLIMINIVAYVFFEERPAPLQIVGLVLGGVSMGLILFPSTPR
jgi:multidrug transporter EmrE-like cation transporter